MTIEPDPAQMQSLVDHLFGDMLEGRVELAWNDAHDGKLKHGQTFDVGDLDSLVEKAVEINGVEGQSVYFGAALRDPNTAPFGRCTDADFFAAPAFWADLDDPGAASSAADRYNGAPPTMAVVTGKHPHPRAQLWWRHEETCPDPETVRRQNAALAFALNGDASVVNPGRVMRLPGSIAWPHKPGRKVEMCELRTFKDRPSVYIDGQLAKSYPPDATKPERTNLLLGNSVDPVAMLRSAMRPGNGHNSIRAFTAHCVAAEMPDWIIIEAARHVLDDPNDPSDIQVLIDGARQKFTITAPANDVAPLIATGLASLIRLDLPPRENVLAPWLPTQGLTMVFADRGLGKTFFALNVAYAVATGANYLGWKAEQPRRVLYVDGEMPAPVMQERARGIACHDPDTSLDDYFAMVTPDLQAGMPPDLSTAQGQARLEPLLDGVELVVLDNLSTLCRSGVENEAESWLPVQGWLLGLRQRGISALYHRAECLTHVGDSQAVRSLTQCGEPMRFAMAAPIDLRNDFDSVSLRRLAKRTRDATQSRRLLALAEVYDGGSRTDASRIGGVGLQIIRDWVLRFNARGPDGLVDGKSPGAPSKLNADHRRALAEVVEAGPVPAVDGVVRWRRKDLARWLLETFAISLDETTVGRELKALGFAKISARPRHYAQNELAVEAFKKNFPAELAKIRARLPKGVEIELWWQDEARIGQKNKLTRRWARRGTRPRAPRDQRTEWAYIFGAICPAKGKGAGLVMPWCDTDAMAAHLIEISAAVDPGAHAVLIVDQAGWHLTPKLAIPDNITVLALPPRSPELNPVENVWQFMRDNWLSNRIFKSYEDIVALCCQAWNNLIDQPWKIMSLGMRKWAHGF